jgi:hypothetical protein
VDFKKFKNKVDVLHRRLLIPMPELMQWKFKDVVKAMELLNIL